MMSPSRGGHAAVLAIDLIDEAGEVVSDDGSTGMKLDGIESMNLHKQRLAPSGRVQSSKDYKAPPPDMIAVIGGMLVSESSKVRATLAGQRFLLVPCTQPRLAALGGPAGPAPEVQRCSSHPLRQQ